MLRNQLFLDNTFMRFAFCSIIASRNVSDWWLAYWISEEKRDRMENKTVSSVNGSLDPNTQFYIIVYGALAGANTVSSSTYFIFQVLKAVVVLLI